MVPFKGEVAKDGVNGKAVKEVVEKQDKPFSLPLPIRDPFLGNHTLVTMSRSEEGPLDFCSRSWSVKEGHVRRMSLTVRLRQSSLPAGGGEAVTPVVAAWSYRLLGESTY